MSNNFCRYLSNGYNFLLDKNNNIKVRPCCLFDGEFMLDSDIHVNRQTYNSINDWTPQCRKCHQLEKIGQQSLRQTSPDWIDDETHTDPVYIEVYLDNTCNAACAICNEDLSSLWFKEKQKLHGKSIRIASADSIIDEKIAQISQSFNFSNLKFVKFYGGEPLFTDSHIKFLKTLPNPQQVVLHYTTNGSIFPSDETLEQWDKFRTVIFSASLDGTDQQFEYLRWPLPWHKVSKNIMRLQQQRLHNLMFRVEYTLNFLNAWYYDKLETWINENLKTNAFGDPTEINLHFVGGGVFDLECMPISLRQQVLEKYPAGHLIHNAVSALKTQHSLNGFVEFINTWDHRRSLEWTNAFPEIHHHISQKVQKLSKNTQ